MTKQLELLQGDLPPEFEALRPFVQFHPAPVPAAAVDRAAWLDERLAEYVAAIGTERPRRSEAKQLLERAKELRGALFVPFERIHEAEQLEEEAHERLLRAEAAKRRAKQIRDELLAHVEKSGDSSSG